MNANGALGPIVANPSAGPGLFGILFAPNGAAIATETGPSGGVNASAVSSYSVSSTGSLSTISASVPTLAAATCWHVVTPNGKYVYTSNPGSGNISGFSLSSTGVLTPIDATILATLPAGSANLDLAITADGKSSLHHQLRNRICQRLRRQCRRLPDPAPRSQRLVGECRLQRHRCPLERLAP